MVWGDETISYYMAMLYNIFVIMVVSTAFMFYFLAVVVFMWSPSSQQQLSSFYCLLGKEKWYMEIDLTCKIQFQVLKSLQKKLKIEI